MASDDATPPSIADGDIVEEDLPLPVVYYPHLFGTFLGFARDRKSAAVMCACARPAVANLLCLYPALRAGRAFHEARRAYFPEAIAGKLSARNNRTALPISFQPGLCHRCNTSRPTRRYCDDSSGPPFIQTCGWYVNQAYLRLGVLPYRHAYLSEVCPPDYQAEIEASKKLEQEFLAECSRLLDVVYSAHWTEVRRDDMLAHDRESSRDDLYRLIDLRQRASGARERFKVRIEDLVRQELGLLAQ
jgi:hypothetical protein